ncbi:MAG: tRNA (N(6)-L-threonylcarbamoyladenosine(37)-C(2))-methylthiotransferase MtaB, partial [Lachnospiraceae bacterium]|nr:tRNA (N(6)-L-threonylcarbamoyladenosine(37)-C(2))-methylthiotransferase MtaB [Lachnospiraceae bacterium]
MSLTGKRIAFHTLGCKVNIYETEVMIRDVLSDGASVVDFRDEADVYVVNTCSVTNIADRKSRQMLHRAKMTNPEALIVACGCYAESEQEDVLKETGAGLILGNEQKKHLADALESWFSGLEAPANPDINKVKVYTPETLDTLTDHTRADVKVQDGCNQFCTYCIIPYVRGRVRSKPLAEAVSEIRALSETGIREFVLSGIHLSSYGTDLDGNVTLSDLISAVHDLPKVERIRLGSLEPRVVTESFAESLASMDKICPHFHLSLQSGDAETLKRMNRKYTPEEYRESVRILREHFANPALTTDVIVGFPGETEELFRSSLEFVRSIGFYELHVFQYSRRKGTIADKMAGQIPPEIKKRRSEQMIALGLESSEAYRKLMIGSAAEVLTEELSDDLSG